MKWFFYALLVLISFVFQSWVFQQLTIFGVKPNIVFVSIIAIAVLEGGIGGGVIAIFGGMLLDIFSMKFFGQYSLIYLYSAMLTSFLVKNNFEKNIGVSCFFIVALTFVNEMLFYFLNYGIWGNGDFLYALIRIIAPVCLYNVIVMLFVFFVVLHIKNQFKTTS